MRRLPARMLSFACATEVLSIAAWVTPRTRGRSPSTAATIRRIGTCRPWSQALRFAGGRSVSTWVETTQIAPTILQLLGLNPSDLKAVHEEATSTLPLGGD